MDVYTPLRIHLSLDGQMTMVKKAHARSECDEKVDIEKGKLETRTFSEETFGYLKNEKEQKKENSFEIGGKYRQLLMNHDLVLPNFCTRDITAAGKFLEPPRMRKYKRSGSINPRKIALLLSALSCFGTIILIYLTLRVKQIGDDSSHYA